MRTLSSLVLLSLTASTALAHPAAVKVPVSTFVSGVAGPEGIAMEKSGHMIIGTSTGEIRRYASDGTSTLVASVGDPLAGITLRRDGRILAAAFGAGRIWNVDTNGATSVLASGIVGVNFVVETKTGHVLASVSNAGTIVDVSTGTPVVRAGGLQYPNGLALGAHHYLYVAETATGQVSRLPLAADGTLGAAEVYATGMPAADGICLDAHGNLFVVGADTIHVVDAKTRAVSTLFTDPLVDWPSNLAFGGGRGFPRHRVFLVNYGFPLGSGSTIISFGYNHTGGRLIR